MPIRNIEDEQKQGRIFMKKLTEELNPRNKLYKVRGEIDWKGLAQPKYFIKM